MTVNTLRPYWGTWSADVVLALGASLPATAAPLVIGDLTLTSTVVRSATFAGARSARLVGGHGGWGKDVGDQDYRGASVKASTVLQDAAASVGEQIAMDAVDTNLQRFTREAGPASRVLRQVAGASWWMAADGVTHIGPRSGVAVKGEFVVISWSGRVGKFEIATETLSEWVPGNTFTDPSGGTQTISSVSIDSAANGTLRVGVLVS